MDLKAIDLVFHFGNIFSLTPPSAKLKRNLSCHQRMYSFCLFAILTTYIFYNTIVRRTVYSRLSVTQLIMAILTTTAYCLHNSYIFITMKIYKHTKWIKLVECLGTTQCHKNKLKIYYIQFVMSQVVVLTLIIAGNAVDSFFLDFNSVLANVMVCTETYLQLFDASLRCTILEMLLSRFKYQNYLLTQASLQKLEYHSYLNTMRRTKYNILILKNAVKIYNDIFGWTTLLNIFTTSIRTLLDIDIFMKTDISLNLVYTSGDIFNMFFQMTVLSICWVIHFVYFK
jgi:hypothetical protein